MILTIENRLKTQIYDLMDGDVEYLHVEINLSMTCSGSHLYSCYRFGGADVHPSVKIF
jgi:hypothetical protein